MKKLTLLICLFCAGISFTAMAMESDTSSSDGQASTPAAPPATPTAVTEPVFFTNEELAAIKANLDQKELFDEDLQAIVASIAQKKPHLEDPDMMALYATIINDLFRMLRYEIDETLADYEHHAFTPAETEFNEFAAKLAHLREIQEELAAFLDRGAEHRVYASLQVLGLGIQQSIPVLLFIQDQLAKAVEATAAVDAVTIATTTGVVQKTSKWPRRLLGVTMLTGLSAIALTYAGNYLGWWIVPTPQGSAFAFLGNITRLFS